MSDVASRTGGPAPWTRSLRGEAGIALVADHFGDPAGRPVILLHGGGQTRHAWGPTGAALAAAGYHAIAPDLRGHGQSSWSPEGAYHLDAFIADLRQICSTLSHAPALVGASMGGLTSLVAQGDDPSLSSAVVLVDIATSVQRAGIDRIIAFMTQKPEGFESLEEVAEAIASYQPQRRREIRLEGLAKNVRKGEDGRYRWHWDPRFLERSKPENSMLAPGRLQEAARALRVPTLLVRGKLSDVVGSDDVETFRQLVPHAEYVDVRSAGHMVAGDNNDVFSHAVTDFLVRHVPANEH